MRKIAFFVLFSFLLLGTDLSAATRYWVASTPSNWNNTLNWSDTPGGVGGQSVPGLLDLAVFNNLGSGNCLMDIAATVNSINTTGYTGIINLFGFAFNPAASGTVASTFGGGTLTANAGYILSFTSNSAITFSGGTINVELDFTAGAIHFNGAIFNLPVRVNCLGSIMSSGAGGNLFASTFEVSAYGTNFFQMGLTNPDIFNGVSRFLNRGASRIRIAHGSAGNQFNNNVIVGSDAGAGVFFCESTGSATLAATRTISIAPIGFTTGQLLLQQITQVGPTAQNITLTGSGYLYSQNSTWGGNVVFSAPSLRTDNSNYLGTSLLHKAGPGSDNSSGNNHFYGNCTISNNNSGVISMGNVFGDDWDGNLTVTNTGTNYIYISANSAFNTIGGNLTVTVATTGTPGNSGVYICGGSNSSLVVSGNAILSSTATASTANLHFGYNGNLTVNGNLSISNTSNSSNNHFNVSFFPGALVTINGTTTVNHSGAGNNNRVILGVYGNCIFNGTVTVNCSSTAINGEVRLNYGVTSTNTYNANVFVNNTGASSDGVRFGDANGVGNMSAGYKLSIGGLGYTHSL